MKKILIILFFSFISLFAFEELNVNNFDEKIKGKKVVVDFYQSWWHSCQALGKSLQKYDASKTDDITIYKVDLGKEHALAKRFNVIAFPAVFYIADGEVMAVEYGSRTAKELNENVKYYFQ